MARYIQGRVMGERLLFYMDCPGETSLSRDLKAVREKRPMEFAGRGVSGRGKSKGKDHKLGACSVCLSVSCCLLHNKLPPNCLFLMAVLSWAALLVAGLAQLSEVNFQVCWGQLAGSEWGQLR